MPPCGGPHGGLAKHQAQSHHTICYSTSGDSPQNRKQRLEKRFAHQDAGLLQARRLGSASVSMSPSEATEVSHCPPKLSEPAGQPLPRSARSEACHSEPTQHSSPTPLRKPESHPSPRTCTFFIHSIRPLGRGTSMEMMGRRGAGGPRTGAWSSLGEGGVIWGRRKVGRAGAGKAQHLG